MRQRLFLLFEDDPESFHYLMRDRPNWPGEHHYWNWLWSKDDDYLVWWAEINLYASSHPEVN